MAEKLTDRTAIAVAVTQTDLLHVVDVSDSTQDPAGSSYKATTKQIINSYLSDGSEGVMTYWDSSTSKYIPISTSGIYHDAVNNRIGVGINTSLTAKLNVKSASGEAVRVDGSSISGIGIVYNDGRFQFGRATSSYIRQIDTSVADNLEIKGDYVTMNVTNDLYVTVTDLIQINTSSYIYLVAPSGITVGANDTPSSSAIIDFRSTTKGVLFPRLTGVQALAITGVDGLMLYVTAISGLFTSVGFWGYENGVWVKL